MQPMTPLDQANQDGSPERQEYIYQAVQHKRQLGQPWPYTEAVCTTYCANAIDQWETRNNSHHDVREAQDPRNRRFQNVLAPDAALISQRFTQLGWTAVAVHIGSHNLLHASNVVGVHSCELLHVVLVENCPSCFVDRGVHEAGEVAHQVQQQLSERLVRGDKAQATRLGRQDTRVRDHDARLEHALVLLPDGAADLCVPVSSHCKDAWGQGDEQLGHCQRGEGAPAVRHHQHHRPREVRRLLVELEPRGGRVVVQAVQGQHFIRRHGSDTKIWKAHVQIRSKLLPSPKAHLLTSDEQIQHLIGVTVLAEPRLHSLSQCLCKRPRRHIV
mmetsp:Transcript_46359/g.88498  ORF Transcript_46359/g.88498 Transcript_46359/m.88498 type:complete len:329 (+) Transcript_46359:1593-2579(+)